MGKKTSITIDALMENELDGKRTAIERYDGMLWKIRSGYAVILYGSIGIVAGLVNQKILALDGRTSLVIGVLVFGFSAFAAFLDYSFLRSKLRVVEYRDRLIEIAYRRAQNGQLSSEDQEGLLECLKNSGEKREPIVWTRRTGFWRPPLLYGGTCTVVALAALILAF